MLLDRPREHSVLHAEALAKEYWFGKKMRQLEAAAGNSLKRKLVAGSVQYMEGPSLDPSAQAVEWLDIGAHATDGFMVDSFPADMDFFLKGRLEQELEEHSLSVRTFDGRGKGLVTERGIAESEVILKAQCMLFGSESLLLEFLRVPGNELYRDSAPRLNSYSSLIVKSSLHMD